ncbi:MAG: ComEA family DNA-binding protein [Planctomycetaceae bacterium]
MTASESETTDAAIESFFGLTLSDQHFLWGTGGLIVLLSLIHWGLLSGWGQNEVEITRLPERQFDFRIDINHATWVEWMQLENIGELTARKIIADRETRGPFHSIDEVDRVPGIGPQTLAAIRPWLICRDCQLEAGSPIE